LLFIITVNAFSQASSKTENIKKLLELTGSAKLGVMIADNFIKNFKSNYKDVPDDFWIEFKKQFSSDALINMLIPIYEKYYTDDDIKQLIAFYETPIGKKVISTMPLVVQESMQAGQIWGQKIGEKVVEDLKAKGYIKAG